MMYINNLLSRVLSRPDPRIVLWMLSAYVALLAGSYALL